MMSYDEHALGEAGLQFFGKMTASISHEIKNVLAIINESAGLLDDLTVLAEKGMPIDPARIKTQAGKIMKQIQRADGIVKIMNRFAHSVDEIVKSVDLYDTTEFVTALSARFASMRGVHLATTRPEKPVTIQTNPFFLEHALWVCLDFAMEKAGKGQTVVLGVDEINQGARVLFTGLGVFKRSPEAPFPGKQEMALIGALGANIEVHEEKGELILSLPSGTAPS
jgi:C4-dicarboxylate-specific signal transduction histidine kinase